MKMRKIAMIGAVALIVLGCVIAAGCTGQSNTSQKDFAIGTWAVENGSAAGLPDGTTVVFKEDFTGLLTAGAKSFNFEWKKTEDGKYWVTREDNVQMMWMPDSATNTMKNPLGVVLKRNQ